MTTPLSPYQCRTLRAIMTHVVVNGHPPTLKELAQRLGCATSSASAYHVRHLVQLGYLYNDGGTRGLRVLRNHRGQRVRLGYYPAVAPEGT